jgi:hypothetical protein
MAKTHMLGLKRVQYRRLRIALGLMGSTPNTPKIRILELQIPCYCFLLIGPPFEGEACSAGSAEHGLLHPGIFRCFIMDIVDIVPFESFTRYELPALLGISLVDGHMKKKLANVMQEAIYSLVAPRELLTVASGYGVSSILYTDGSLIESCACFGVHQMSVGGYGHKILSLAGVFTAELSSLFTALLLRLYGLRRDVLFSLIA